MTHPTRGASVEISHTGKVLLVYETHPTRGASVEIVRHHLTEITTEDAPHAGCEC